MNWISDLADAARPLEDPPLEPPLVPLGNTFDELIHQIAEAYSRPQTRLTQQYIAEAKHRLAKLGAA